MKRSDHGMTETDRAGRNDKKSVQTCVQPITSKLWLSWPYHDWTIQLVKLKT